MWASYATGMIGVAMLVLVWVGVQSAWRRAFPEAFDDPDVLAPRLGCGGCDQEQICERRPSNGSGSGRGEIS